MPAIRTALPAMAISPFATKESPALNVTLPTASIFIFPAPLCIVILPAVVKLPPASKSNVTPSSTVAQVAPPSHTLALSVKSPVALSVKVLPFIPLRSRLESTLKLPPAFTVTPPTPVS